MTIRPDWVAVDWGTSNLRLWALDRDDKVLAETRSDQGMGSLRKADFPNVLASALSDWDTADVPLIACGMVGSRQGWAEAAYRQVPCAPLASEHLTRATAPDGPSLWIVPGLCQMNPADVIRGEETQIAGFIAGNPGFEGTLCLPGTHTKWVGVAGGEITWFRTHMSGEVFALLGTKSVLQHSIDDNWNQHAFLETAHDIITGKDTANPFQIRAAQLLGQQDISEGRARLSAHLIGTEVMQNARALSARDAAVIGSGEMAQAYRAAISVLRPDVEIHAETPLTLAGLAMAHRSLLETQG